MFQMSVFSSHWLATFRQTTTYFKAPSCGEAPLVLKVQVPTSRAPVRPIGMTSLAVLQAGLLNGAKLLGWEGQIGSLEKGYYADIIAVPGDPLADISMLEQVVFVMKGGVVYKK